MSYNSSARKVRDASLPVPHRHSALRSCILHLVWLTHQSSYRDAVARFNVRCGLDGAEAVTEEKLMEAFAAVEEERAVALEKVKAFARKRKQEKFAGRSTPSKAELDAFFLSLSELRLE